MSASSKKKLRAVSANAKLTEKQLAEQKEAKKLKVYTIVFVIVLIALIAIAICVGVSRTVASSGMRERSTTAVTINGHELSNAELSYYYIDEVNQFYSQNGSYAPMFGLDLSKPLDQQFYSEEDHTTWADYFISSAKQNAAATYALVDAAAAEGFTVSEDAKQSVESLISNMEAYSVIYGFQNMDAYIKAYYGNGATVEGFREYSLRNNLASEYYNNYRQSLTYTDEQLREAEKDNFGNYSSFTYNQYYLSTSRFLTGGTTDADGKVVYSDAEKEASVAAAETAAKSISDASITSVEAFDAAVAGLDVNADSETPVSSAAMVDVLYASANASIKDWLADASRVEGDKTYIASSSTTTDDNGNSVTTVNGYYVVYFISRNDNLFPLVNARHILVGYEGGTEGENGVVTYSDEEKAEAKAKSEAILNEWKNGDATEASFAALADEKSTDTGSLGKGGLYENIYPNQMVAAFNDWCFAEGRNIGDTGIVETEYGYHVMYFVGNSSTTYRDYMITQELATEDLENWYTGLTGSPAITDGNTKYMRTDIVLQSAQ